MTCRDIPEALDALLDGELDPVEEAAVRAHLETCGDCREALHESSAWHETLTGAFARGFETVEAPVGDRRRLLEALARVPRRRPALSLARLAALLVIGASLGVVVSAVSLSHPPGEEVARVVERMKERRERDAELQAMNAEIDRDLREARAAAATRSAEDLAAGAVTIAAWNLERLLAPAPSSGPVGNLVADTASPDPERRAAARAGLRRLDGEKLEELRRAPGGDRPFVDRVVAELEDRSRPAERVSVTRTVEGKTVSVSQRSDGRVVVVLPDLRLEASGMAELLSRHGELCRRYGISGSDGRLSLGDSAAGVDWKGRLDLLFRTGTWDPSAQWDTYRGWAAGKVPDARELERRVQEHQERCRRANGGLAPVTPPVDVDAILREVRTLTRTELRKTQEQVDAEMKRLDARLKDLSELRGRARGLRVLAEEVTRD